MSLTPSNNNFTNRGKDIKYLNKDFSAFRDNLIEFSKTYFPKTNTDFTEASPGMMFIEMASYIGDVLSYYIDDTFKESLITTAEDLENVIALAHALGYKPKVTAPATTLISVYQIVPAIGSGILNEIDTKYLLRIRQGMEIESKDESIKFITTDIVDFSDTTDRDITVYQRDANTGEPTLYLVKKYVQAISATSKEATFEFGSYTPFQTINLSDTNIIEVYDVRDSNNNKYYEVPYLAQEMVFLDYANTELNDPDLVQFKDSVPYILKTLKTPRRFVSKVNPDLTTTIQFGAGDPSASDEQLIPNLKNVGLGLPNSIKRLEESFDPTNFLKTKTYGTSPSNTSITVKYYVGGGILSNIESGQLTRITSIVYDNDYGDLNQSQIATYNSLKNSVAVTNEIPASGGRGSETLEEIRQNALANFGSQNRAVTTKDYQVRALSMPTKYGSVSKCYATADGKLDNNSPSSILASPKALQEFTDLVMGFVNKPDLEEPTQETVSAEIRDFLIGKTSNDNEKNNPFAINLYMLGLDGTGRLTQINRAVKENLKTYLNEYKILTDGVNFSDGFIINIGVNFEVACYPNFNKSEIVAKCILELKNYFNIDKWTFNQTINLSQLELILANVEGVSSVPFLQIVNKCGGQYSTNSYNIEAATKNKVVYPSLDPSVFEIKFPDSDIKGRAK
jgi:hypothetical protein